MQRVLDILIAGCALILFLPILLSIALILRCTGEREVFYVQQRVGRWGRPFGLIKFATMTKDSPTTGTGLFTTKNDPRVLPFGRVLRRTKLNEMPQILNVLAGQISVVGPRPQVRDHFDYYPEHVRRRLVEVRPGLTGIGSIVFRDEEEILSSNGMGIEECYRNVIAPYKGELELWYLEHRSIRLYLTLIFVTAWVIPFRKSQFHLRAFQDLPQPPAELTQTRRTGS